MPRVLLVPLLLIAACLGGCAMERTITIDSNPTGADVWVNGERLGQTPVTVPFDQYGYFDVRLEKKGYDSVATQVRVASQIDGYPVVDLPFEVLGGKRSFRRILSMTPTDASDPAQRVDEIMRRANGFRDATHKAVGEPETPGRQAPEFVR